MSTRQITGIVGGRPSAVDVAQLLMPTMPTTTTTTSTVKRTISLPDGSQDSLEIETTQRTQFGPAVHLNTLAMEAEQGGGSEALRGLFAGANIQTLNINKIVIVQKQQ